MGAATGTGGTSVLKYTCIDECGASFRLKKLLLKHQEDCEELANKEREDRRKVKEHMEHMQEKYGTDFDTDGTFGNVFSNPWMIDNSGGDFIDMNEYKYLPVSVYSMKQNETIADFVRSTNKWIFNCCAIMDFTNHRFSADAFKSEVVEENKDRFYLRDSPISHSSRFEENTVIIIPDSYQFRQMLKVLMRIH